MGNPISDYFKDICPCCFGQGKVKAMQSYMTYDAGSVRGPDTWVTCPVCKGTGKEREIKNEKSFKENHETHGEKSSLPNGPI